MQYTHKHMAGTAYQKPKPAYRHACASSLSGLNLKDTIGTLPLKKGKVDVPVPPDLNPKFITHVLTQANLSISSIVIGYSY